MTAAEEMALAVLKGDLAAARALADHLQEQWRDGVEVLPVTSLKCDMRKLRAVFTVHPWPGPDANMMDKDALMSAFHDWVQYGKPMTLVGVRMDLYELDQEAAREDPMLRNLGLGVPHIARSESSLSAVDAARAETAREQMRRGREMLVRDLLAGAETERSDG